MTDLEENAPVRRPSVWKHTENGVTYSLESDSIWKFRNKDGKEEILDYPLWQSRVNKIFSVLNESLRKDVAKYCTIPAEVRIVLHHTEVEGEKGKTEENGAQTSQSQRERGIADQIEVHDPRWKFSDIYIDDDMLASIEKSLLIARHKEELFSKWKLGNGTSKGRAIVFNFYGPSGTGKSMTGEAIAGELGKKVYSVNYAELESKYVGETPKNIVAVFQRAQKDNAVLIFDEADSFLGKRLTSVTQSSDYGVNITRSVMLMELEKFDGIVIFTTNLLKNYDDAFKRRILTSMRFALPNTYGREKIWHLYLKGGVPLAEGITAAWLAREYEGLSGADIKDMLLFAAVSALYRDEENPLVTKIDFAEAYKMVMKRQETDEAKIISVKHETVTEEEYKETLMDDDCEAER